MEIDHTTHRRSAPDAGLRGLAWSGSSRREARAWPDFWRGEACHGAAVVRGWCEDSFSLTTADAVGGRRSTYREVGAEMGRYTP